MNLDNHSGVKPEQQNNFQHKRELQAQRKAAQRAATFKSKRITALKKVGYWLVGLTIVLGGGWLLVNVTSPKGQDYSQSYPLLGRAHITDGLTATYNSNPPTSGDHYAVAAPTRFYDRELPDEQLVHNLEHGHVWISYKPNLATETIDLLKGFGGGNVIVTPRSKNDTDIALAAWGRLDKFNLEADEIDQQRIKDFILRYQGRGPESTTIQSGHLR